MPALTTLTSPRVATTAAAWRLAALLGALIAPSASAQNPIRIGFSMALTGPLAANGKQALLGMKKLWR